MKILHGTCLFSRSAKRSVGQGTFFLWGESTHSFRKRGRGRPPKIPRHPFHATRQEILKIITSNNLLKDKRITQKAEDITRIFLLPSRNKFPQASSNLLCKGGIKHIEEATKLSQWKITGISLQLEDALLLLISLTDSTFKSNDVLIGEDLIFWGKFYKLALEMLIKQKFLPGTFNYDEQHDEYEVNWEYLLVSEEDKTRMNKLVKVIPPVCMANIYNNNNKNNNKNGTTDRSRKLFLSRCLVKLITGCIKNWLFSSHRDFKNHNFSGMWLQSLLIRDTIPSSELLPYKNDINKISRWKNQRTEGAAAKFKVCFRLDEPRSKEKNEDSEKWHLQYYLQDIKDPSLIVPAKKVWAESKETLNFLNRKYNRPQEKLLMGLGKASQIYNPIEKSLHQSKPEGILLTTAQAHQFLKEAAVLLKQSGFSVLIPSWWKSNKKKSTIGLKLTLKSKKSSTTSKGILTYEGIIKYNWQLALGDETLSKEEFKKIVELKEPLTHVRGKWVLLNQDNLKKALSFLNNKTRGELSITDALKLSVQKENTHFGLPLHGFSATGWISDFFDKLSHTSKIKMLEQPNTFQGELRPYQIKGFSWLYFMKRYGLGTCLADDMGLGKTIQILALLLKEKENGMNKPSLLVCPTSILGNWKREAHQFSPSLNVMIHHGSNRKTRKEFRTIVKRKDLIITSYGLTYRDKTDLMSIEWHGLILDEAQKIKNYYTRRSQAVRKLNANFRIALTGTPIENRLSELWSIMEFLNPGYFNSLPQFRKNYIIPIERYNNKKVRARLKKVIQPFILRRLKTDPTIIKDLPEKIEKKEYCRLTQEQATLYKAIVKNLLKKVDNEEGIKRKGVILSTIMRLKQLCDHPVLYLTDSSKISKRSTKLIRLVELMEELLDEGHSALIFTQFKKMGNIIQRVLQQTFNQEVLFLHGGTSQQKRDKMVTRFSRENGPRIFILSLRAGGLGLNLTRANHVFHFDRWWNPAVENQATDRAYRIGQTKNVLVYKFICEGTIEEKIEDLINSKKHLAKSIIGSGEGWITELTTEQLRDIFKLKQEIF